MAPKKGIFTNELDFHLVEEVERRPILWDCTLDVYRRTDLKSNAWDQVATALGPNFTSDSVADRWKNIKQTFMSNHKKVRESKNKCSGVDGDGIYVPKWHLYKKLFFLEKACAQADSSSNLPAIQSQTKTSMSTELMKIYFDENLQMFVKIPDDPNNETFSKIPDDQNNEMFSKIPDDPNNEMFSKFPDDPNNDLQPVCEGATTNSPTTNSSCTSLMSLPSASSANSSRPLTSPVLLPPARPASAPCNNLYENRGIKRYKSTAIMEKAIDLMQKANQPLPLTSPQEDDADIFGNLVATRIRSLEKEKRKQCENEILMVLTRY